MKIHLGCGPRFLPGYIHVDIQEYQHVDHIADITQDLTHLFPEGSVDEIYACHVLEHISRRNIVETLCHWNKILRVGGILRIAVPDFEAVVNMYNQDVSQLYTSLLGLLYGGQRNTYDYHTITFDLHNIKILLHEIGFVDIERYAWQDFLPDGYDDYSRCYLPHGDITNGKLMSLNITAKKVSSPTLSNQQLLEIITKKSKI